MTAAIAFLVAPASMHSDNCFVRLCLLHVYIYTHVHMYTSMLKLHMRFKIGVAKIVQNSVARQRQMDPV